MTLEQWAYIGEIAAAVAVVASLMYVARQLGQNTTMMKATSASERIQRDFDIAFPIVENRGVAEIWVKGRQGLDNLDEVDRWRIMFLEREIIIHWNHVFQLKKQGLLPDSDWNEQQWIIQNMGNHKAMRASWEIFKGAYEETFQDFVEGLFAIADGGPESVVKA